jgi:hypothetical protein
VSADRHPVSNPRDFTVCPHCWHVNGPMSRICIACRADMRLVLQESGGERWAAAIQSPVPMRGGARLTRAQRAILFGFLVLFAVGQLVYAFSPRPAGHRYPAVPGGR